MPIFRTNTQYKPNKSVAYKWDTFRKGLNTLLRENEIAGDELTQAENILLKGRGVPTKRWGTNLYFQAGNATGSVRGLKGFYKSDGTNELLALTDDGYLTKKAGASYSTLTGASWASGYNAYMAQLSNSMYIVNGQRELVRYSSPTLVGFPTIAIPASLVATNLSGATGTNTKSYRVTAVSTVGETLPSTAISLSTQPQTLGGAGGQIRVSWAAVSTASGVLTGYNIYGRDAGEERFLGAVDASSTSFIDDGSATPREFTFTPTADSTGGPKAKYVKRFQDRLIFAGLDGEPSKVLISGRAPNHEKFDLASGGNFINIEPDAGDDIVQIEVFRDRIIVFKQKSIWQITITFEQVGNFFITTPILQLITASNGCIAPRSVVPVENDIYFMSRRGINSLGHESGFAFDVLRSNEISLKIRPFINNLTNSQKMNAVATYKDFKFIIAFPGLAKTMIFDRERAAWLGPWTVDANVFETYYDSDNTERLIFGNDNNANVDEYSETYTTDNGATINTILRTRLEDFGDWSLFKNIKNIFVQFRNITGTVAVDIQLEQKNGTVVTASSFNVTPATGNTGWGADMWGSALWGNSNGNGAGGVDAQQTIRWARLFKTARTLQLTVRTTGANDNYELLGSKGDAIPTAPGYRPKQWRI